VWVGGPNVAFKPHSDWGDPTPTDMDFTPQTIINPSTYGELAHSPKPRLRLRLHLATPTDPVVLPPLKGGISIDIATTKIIDSRYDNDRVAKLTSVFHGISENNQLLVRPSVKLGDDEHTTGAPLDRLVRLTNAEEVALREDALVAGDEHPEGAEFDFKFDSEESVYGAGTAFLRD